MYFYKAPTNVVSKTGRTVLLTLPQSRTLGKDVGKLLGVPPGKLNVGKFKDGEVRMSGERRAGGA